MKRINLIAAGCLLLTNFCLAQEFPDFGVASADEATLKQCSFDKDANAVILLHEAFSGYDDQHRLLTTHHIKIKILREKGVAAANVSIPFYKKDDFEQIDMVEGLTINITGGTTVKTTLAKKSVFTKEVNERYGEVIFAFPEVKPGSIIEYRYRSTMKNYGGLEDWSFQEEFPVIMSRYTLEIVPNAEFAYRIDKAPEMPVIVKKESSTGGVYFEMSNIPGLGDEPYMDARQDYLQKIVFQLSGYDRGGGYSSRYMTSWDEVTRELLYSPDFGSQLNKNIAGTEDFIKQTKALPLPEEKMKAVFNFVRHNVNWNGLYSKYVVEGVKNAWQKRGGNSGDINLLLVNLLKQVSLDAYPMLVSERFHGKVNTAYPFIDQFNSVFACVDINKRKFFLDATDKSITPGLTPVTILNTTAFVVNRKAGGLIDITDDLTQYEENIIANLAVAENGTLTGNVTVNSSDYARIKKLDEYKADKTKFLNRHFIVDGTSIAGKELEVTNVANDSLPFEQACKLSGNLTTTGEYSFLPLNLFTGFDNNPFISDNRFSNINFGYRRKITLNVAAQLPPGFVIDEIPRSVRLTDPDQDIIFMRQVTFNKEENSISSIIRFEFKKSLYEVDMYPIVKEVYQKIFDYLKEPVVLKRK